MQFANVNAAANQK